MDDTENIKPVNWVGSSYKDFRSFPEKVQDEFGYQLYVAQIGNWPTSAKQMKGMSGVVELIRRYDKDTYRAVYVTNLNNAIYVLHSFKKKSKQGIETPANDIKIIKERLKAAKEDNKNGKRTYH